MASILAARAFIEHYQPGYAIYNDSLRKKLPRALPIAVIGPTGHGKSSLINTMKSSYLDDEPFTFAPLQDVQGKHGSNVTQEYNLTPHIVLCDTRGNDFRDNASEKSELESILGGTMEYGKEVIRRNDIDQWGYFTGFSNWQARFFQKEPKICMVLIVLSLKDYTLKTPNSSILIDIKKIMESLKSYKIKPMIVLTNKNAVTDENTQETRETLSAELAFDISHIVAVENYTSLPNDDPLKIKTRDDELEFRVLRTLKMALQLAEEQLKLIIA